MRLAGVENRSPLEGAAPPLSVTNLRCARWRPTTRSPGIEPTRGADGWLPDRDAKRTIFMPPLPSQAQQGPGVTLVNLCLISLRPIHLVDNAGGGGVIAKGMVGAEQDAIGPQ